MKNETTLWVVEWSDSQKAMHIDPIEIGKHTTWSRFMGTGEAGDWTIVAVAESHAEAHRLANQFEDAAAEKGVDTLHNRLQRTIDHA